MIGSLPAVALTSCWIAPMHHACPLAFKSAFVTSLSHVHIHTYRPWRSYRPRKSRICPSGMSEGLFEIGIHSRIFRENVPCILHSPGANFNRVRSTMWSNHGSDSDLGFDYQFIPMI
ncbi:hypothetical protein BDV28DRAFT_139899, partial [Aspergillus coremiiformis]